MPTPLCDAHNHLHDPRFGGRQEEIVGAMRDAGVAACVANGTREDDWPAVAALAERFPGFVMPAFGLHPWHAHRRSPQWLDELARWLERFPHASVGECGVDRRVAEAPIDVQQEVFRAQLALAADRRLPVTVHCLGAWGILLECLQSAPPPPCGLLLHSFGGSPEVAARLVPLGARFSFSGRALHPRAGAAALAALRAVPGDRLLLETDAPDMLPPAGFIARPLAAAGGSPLNHPANLPAIAAGLAAALRIAPAALCALTTGNFRALFRACQGNDTAPPGPGPNRRIGPPGAPGGSRGRRDGARRPPRANC